MESPPTQLSARGLTVEGAGPDLLRELLPDFERELRLQGVQIDDLLQPGCDPRDVREVGVALGLNIPDELVVWFGWRNGVRSLEPIPRVLPQFDFWPLDLVARRHGTWPFGFGLNDWEWNPNWLHFMGDQHGLAMSCEEPPENAPLIRALTEEDGTQSKDTRLQAVSLCTPVTWWIDALRRGWYRWDRTAQNWEYEDFRVHPEERWRVGMI